MLAVGSCRSSNKGICALIWSMGRRDGVTYLRHPGTYFWGLPSSIMYSGELYPYENKVNRTTPARYWGNIARETKKYATQADLINKKFPVDVIIFQKKQTRPGEANEPKRLIFHNKSPSIDGANTGLLYSGPHCSLDAFSSIQNFDSSPICESKPSPSNLQRLYLLQTAIVSWRYIGISATGLPAKFKA